MHQIGTYKKNRDMIFNGTKHFELRKMKNTYEMVKEFRRGAKRVECKLFCIESPKDNLNVVFKCYDIIKLDTNENIIKKIIQDIGKLCSFELAKEIKEYVIANADFIREYYKGEKEIVILEIGEIL